MLPEKNVLHIYRHSTTLKKCFFKKIINQQNQIIQKKKHEIKRYYLMQIVRYYINKKTCFKKIEKNLYKK